MAEIDAPPLETLAIVGLGLIGSSIAPGARQYGLVRSIVAIDRDPAVIERVRALGLADEATGEAEAIAGADLVILCVPVGAVGSRASAWAIAARPAARSPALVGLPCWSSTTLRRSRSFDRRSIVLTKLPRCGLTTQAVRTMAWRGLPERTAISPAALLAP